MKNINLKTSLFLLLIGLLITSLSCSKKDDPTPESMIVGKWVMESYEGTSLGIDECSIDNNYYDFKKDGSFKFTIFMKDGNECSPAGELDGFYELEGSEKIYFYEFEDHDKDDYEMFVDIISLSKNKMVLGDDGFSATWRKQ